MQIQGVGSADSIMTLLGKDAIKSDDNFSSLLTLLFAGLNPGMLDNLKDSLEASKSSTSNNSTNLEHLGTSSNLDSKSIMELNSILRMVKSGSSSKNSIIDELLNSSSMDNGNMFAMLTDLRNSYQNDPKLQEIITQIDNTMKLSGYSLGDILKQDLKNGPELSGNKFTELSSILENPPAAVKGLVLTSENGTVNASSDLAKTSSGSIPEADVTDMKLLLQNILEKLDKNYEISTSGTAVTNTASAGDNTKTAMDNLVANTILKALIQASGKNEDPKEALKDIISKLSSSSEKQTSNADLKAANNNTSSSQVMVDDEKQILSSKQLMANNAATIKLTQITDEKQISIPDPVAAGNKSNKQILAADEKQDSVAVKIVPGRNNITEVVIAKNSAKETDLNQNPQQENKSFGKNFSSTDMNSTISSKDSGKTEKENIASLVQNSSISKAAEAPAVETKDVVTVRRPEDIINTVVERFKALKLPETTELKVKLRPDDLGEITVKVVLEKGQVNGTISADRKEVVNMLQNQLENIKMELKNSNVNLNNLSVNISSDDSNSRQGSRQFSQGERQNSRRPMETFDEKIKVSDEEGLNIIA